MGRRSRDYRAVKWIIILDKSGAVQYRFELDNKGQIVRENSPFVPQVANVASRKIISIPMTNTSILPPCLRYKPPIMNEFLPNLYLNSKSANI